MRDESNSALSGAIKGAIAGAVAVWVMDRVTWAMYEGPDPASESDVAHRQEKQAQPEGKWAAHVAAAKAGRLAGVELSHPQEFAAGKAIHYMMGVVPGAIYGAVRKDVPAVSAGRGLAYGLGLFLAVDETVNPLLGLSSGPTAYPIDAHWRGLVGHLVLGAVTETVLGALDEVV